MSAEIYLVRHGETEWNKQQRIQGWLDSPLTAKGRDQAICLGQILAANLGAQHALPMHVSPLQRARETATIIRQYAYGPDVLPAVIPNVIYDPRIREMSLGAWEGMTREEVESAYPDVADDDAWWFRAPGGESYSQLKARIEEWISSLTSPVIAVSHGMAGRLIRGLLLGLPTEEALTLPSPQDVVWHLADHRIEALTLIP